MRSQIVILSILGLVAVNQIYGQTPCSHNRGAEPKPQPTNLETEYLPAPASLDLSYLPPDNRLPQANQVKPVFVAPPKHLSPPELPRQAPQATYVKPVYQPLPSTIQPKLVPLPKLPPLPAYQPIPSTTQPKLAPAPFPSLRPLPQTTYNRPVLQPLPKLQPLPSVSYSKPLPPLPRLAQSPLPTLPPLKPIVPEQSKLYIPPKFTQQPKENSVQQASNVVPKLAKPDLEPAAQTTRFSLNRPDIKIHHYVCDIGNADQKFLCDIFRLWHIHHTEGRTNDLDNPSDNSINSPTFAKLPTPKPRIPEQENEPNDSQQNLNKIYLPPQPTYTTPRPTQPTTVEIPKRTTTTTTTPVYESDDSETVPKYTPPSTIPTTTAPTTRVTGYDYPKPQPSPASSNLIPAKEGYEYPKPSVPFPPPSKGYDYPKPSVSFTDGAFGTNLNSPNSINYESLDSGKSSISAFQDRLNLNSLGSEGALYKSTGAPIFTSSLIPSNNNIYLKSNAESVSYNSPFSPSLPTLSPVVTYKGEPNFSPENSVLYTTPVPTPGSSYVSTLAPLLLSKESLALSSNSANLPSSFYSSTLSPNTISLDGVTEKPFAFQTLSGETLQPLSYQPVSNSLFQDQGFSFAPTFGSGLTRVSEQTFSSPGLAGISYTSSTPFPSSFQSFASSAQSNSLGSTQSFPSTSGQTFGTSGISYTSSALPQSSLLSSSPFTSQSSAASSAESTKSGQSFSSSSATTFSSTPLPTSYQSFAPSGLTFGSNVQSVENLRDLQATAKSLNIDLNLDSEKYANSINDKIGGSRKSSDDSKEDISLGNIEILKVKRKTVKA